MDSLVAPLFCVRSSLNPRTEIIQGRQQQIVAHKMNGIAYPIQLNVRNTKHNLSKPIISIRCQKENIRARGGKKGGSSRSGRRSKRLNESFLFGREYFNKDLIFCIK